MEVPEKNDMHLQGPDISLKEFLYLIFKKRWILFFSITFTLVITSIYTFKQVPIYRSTALVLIEKPARGFNPSGLQREMTPELRDLGYYNTQYEIIRSRMLSKRVSKALDLDSLSYFSKQNRPPEDIFQHLIQPTPTITPRFIQHSIQLTLLI